jgi:2-keto-4-pentenoate hydratase/2-oxohepta-3-ene-1,7-dioic acid hydratase in catechol pathway
MDGGRSQLQRSDCQLLSPVAPSKIVCVGWNYAAHAAELRNEMPKEPLIFLKPPSSCVNDVTARDLQKAEVQFTRAKGFDTFCPAGPHIETEVDARNVLVETRVNGAGRQSGSTALMTFPAMYLVRWISRVMTLVLGDLIATGTPAGVGPLVAGDSVEVSVAGIGVLRNPVHSSAV